ncbi:glycosyltransferase family 2 protein [Salegentibacter chungangensis]|uniref:Glycosyltransferase family 2 protein n=1 Tax=Salegentibacter chungangensis TaxID=1335724 RepID=A0ABW3NQR1_9FLAO
MKTAVVILNWNGKGLLEKFLPSVISYSPEANIYVADNASTDDSVRFVEQNFPQVSIIRNKVNGGYAKGYNDALLNLREDIFILLNSDVEVSKNWLLPILKVFDNEPETAVVQPKILDYYNRKKFEYAGAAGGFIDKYAYPFCRGRIFENLEEDHGQYNEDSYIFWASGACLAIRKSAFYKAGALDESFFAHQEEIDLCWRLQNLGYKVKYAGASRVFHVGGATLDTMNPRKTFFNFRNSLFLILKNVPSPQLYSILLIRMLLDGLAGIRFLTQGKFSHFFAIMRAHFSFYRHFSEMFRKRKSTPKKLRYYKLESIVWSYFIRKKTKFTSL